MKKFIRWKVVLYLTAIFATGSISGWVVATRAAKDKAFTPPKPNEIAASLRERLHSKLDLTPAQAAEVDRIIERSSKEIQSVHGDCLKRIRQGISSRNAQINAILRPEQQRIFQVLEKERHTFSRGKEGRRGRGKGRGRDDGSREEETTNNKPWRSFVTNDVSDSHQPNNE